MPEQKASHCIQPGAENKGVMRNDSGRSNTTAKQYYLRQSRYLPGKGKSQHVMENANSEQSIHYI